MYRFAIYSRLYSAKRFVSWRIRGKKFSKELKIKLIFGMLEKVLREKQKSSYRN